MTYSIKKTVVLFLLVGFLVGKMLNLKKNRYSSTAIIMTFACIVVNHSN